MADLTPTPQDEQDDADMASFVRVARASLKAADPVPVEVTELAKLAFEFRGIETVELVDTSELAGVRSGDAVANALQAAKGDTTIIWSTEDHRLTGVVHSPRPVSLAVQTQRETTAQQVANDGSFDAAHPASAYRLIINDGEEWATPWTD